MWKKSRGLNTFRRHCMEMVSCILTSQLGMNIMHCAAINNHTDIMTFIIYDLMMKELDKEDLVTT